MEYKKGDKVKIKCAGPYFGQICEITRQIDESTYAFRAPNGHEVIGSNWQLEKVK